MDTRMKMDPSASSNGRGEMGRSAGGRLSPDLDAEALERCRVLAEIEELLDRNPFLVQGGQP